MWLFLMALVFCLMILTIVEKVLRLYDRWEMNRISKDLAKQLEEEETYEKGKRECATNKDL